MASKNKKNLINVNMRRFDVLQPSYIYILTYDTFIYDNKFFYISATSINSASLFSAMPNKSAQIYKQSETKKRKNSSGMY